MKTSHVYVVLECNTDETDPVVHGVFAHREHAEAKATKLRTRHHRVGYLCVLKQRVHGWSLK